MILHSLGLHHAAFHAVSVHLIHCKLLGMRILTSLRGVNVAAAECWKNLADAHFARRAIREALTCLGYAARLGLTPHEAIGRRWMCWMMLGDYERAWRESDLLAHLHDAGDAPGHLWDGRPFEGRRVLLRCCHGLGDTLQFIRYAPALAERCRSLTVQAQRELWPLLRELPGIGRLVASWEDLPPDIHHDQEIEIMELPYAFRTTAATVPNKIPYLGVEPERVRKMRRLLENSAPFEHEHRRAEHEGKGSPQEGRSDAFSALRAPRSALLRVGLIWAASAWDARRSVPLELLAPLARLPGVALYSLQWGPEREQLQEHPGLPVADLSAVNQSILDSAALMRSMDLVICPDTMAAHLAGALGVPVWLLLLHAADWRWMAARDTTPWYPAMRLFRQPAPGDWQIPIARVTEELRALATARAREAQAMTATS